MRSKDFIKLDYSNMEKYYRTRKLIKGALVRYRFNHNTILSYHLVEEEEVWRTGIVSDVSWHIFKPPVSLYLTDPDKEQICYDLTVYQSDGTGIEMINLESNEIFLLAD
tara:strand:- start:1320 stop:1646 length:327 start_codon:yes stop_codon:yes gene_type:complete